MSSFVNMSKKPFEILAIHEPHSSVTQTYFSFSPHARISLSSQTTACVIPLEQNVGISFTLKHAFASIDSTDKVFTVKIMQNLLVYWMMMPTWMGASASSANSRRCVPKNTNGKKSPQRARDDWLLIFARNTSLRASRSCLIFAFHPAFWRRS